MKNRRYDQTTVSVAEIYYILENLIQVRFDLSLDVEFGGPTNLRR